MATNNSLNAPIPFALNKGGTAATLTASNGGVVYSNASTLAILAGTSTAGQMLQSGASTTPGWSTPTWPSTSGSAGKILRSDGTNNAYTTSTFADTYGASTILYANGANTVAGLATANSSVLVTTSAGVPVQAGTMTNGQLVIGSTGATPAVTTLTPGTGISIANAAGTITISSSGAGLSTVTVSGTTQAIAVSTRYFANNAGLVTLTLPASAIVGDTIKVNYQGAGGWLIAQNSGQSIVFGNVTTTTGVSGSLASSAAGDNVTLVCEVANTTWQVEGSQGNLTFV